MEPKKFKKSNVEPKGATSKPKFKGVITILDKQGNVLVGEDLIVRHKDSGLTYTVGSISYDGKGRPISVELLSPDSLEPLRAAEERLMVDAPVPRLVREERRVRIKLHEEGEMLSMPAFHPESFEPDGLVVSIEEFKNEYEVV
jgi:hypothetical protein